MKKLILILLLISPVIVRAQFDDLIKKTAVPDLLEEKNITTSIEDAYPIAFWLGDLDQTREPVEPADYNAPLAPGYYRLTVQSYCLKAGTHAPTMGNGHLFAPIKGKRDDLVVNILTRSVDHPEIQQHDIQLLLWSIIYGAKFTDLEPGLQMRVKPLMTDAEIADLSIGIKDIPTDILPGGIKETAEFYKSLRQRLTDPASSYEDIERMAVLPGDPPSDLLKRQVNPGNWAYIGDGFYMRIMPEGYQKSVLEIYRPGSVSVTRDNLQRITALERDGYKTEIVYQDEPGSDVLFADGKYYPIYRFKSITYSGPNPGEEFTVENSGWMIKDDGKELKNVTEYKNYPQDPTASEYKTRLSSANEFFKQIKKYKKDTNNPGKGGENSLTDGFNADKHFKDGMEAATNPTDLKKKGKWINKNIEHTKDWWNCASNVLAGGSCDDDNQPKKPKPQKNAGAPGNTGGQRIAPSLRKFGE
jgi:hypothetical protein